MCAVAKTHLKAQLAELEGRQGRIARDLAEPLNPKSSEQAVEMEDDNSLEGQAALVAREIASVKGALMRIENGTYGECVRCGAEIAPKRLAARPEAALCFECASKNSDCLLHCIWQQLALSGHAEPFGRMSAFGGDLNRSTQHFVLKGKDGVSGGARISSRFYCGREDGAVGSLAAGKVAESDWPGVW